MGLDAREVVLNGLPLGSGAAALGQGLEECCSPGVPLEGQRIRRAVDIPVVDVLDLGEEIEDVGFVRLFEARDDGLDLPRRQTCLELPGSLPEVLEIPPLPILQGERTSPVQEGQDLREHRVDLVVVHLEEKLADLVTLAVRELDLLDLTGFEPGEVLHEAQGGGPDHRPHLNGFVQAVHLDGDDGDVHARSDVLDPLGLADHLPGVHADPVLGVGDLCVVVDEPDEVRLQKGEEALGLDVP